MPSTNPHLEPTPEQLSKQLESLNQPGYRARQILSWIYQKGARDFDSMTDLPRSLRTQLGRVFNLLSHREIARSATPGGTVKLLLEWSDGSTTETVMIPAAAPAHRRTACLSTQVGCDVGCRFCASGIGGSKRNLTAGEIVEQAVAIDAMLRQRDERLSHIVFMGMGEPLANYEATTEAIRRLIADWCLGLAQRRITISTVGLPTQIERLATEGLQVTLALSLHAPTDELRRDLIPWAQGVPLDRLLESCHTYRQRTGREVTLEYCLLADVNDHIDHAVRLAAIAMDLKAHINLLMYNPVADLPFSRPSRNRAIAFLRKLRQLGAKANLRESRGLEADAACGQLRRRTEN